ncbi:LysR family transcriptional regulator [Bradyrhizobium manausense]|uniref:LysR family transcriptional regulator n=1 Tax=Bradyrhizobium TaxID=374 RepID=UPI001BAB20ED|nr:MULTISPECIES: LysR family transcriptional regulator [Bradyrhizobium]MBR0827737.1 LysR family transcriptional regulator [Bradyrhizobium manausense]UVO26211.1 LysR family transcriptional regulator [Bradyrhizobium arachidis]
MRFDLNLAAVLEAIMMERNVTRAAAALGMSQPAVSNALRRARALAGDRLFLKVAAGMQPTARMLAIWPELHRSLGMIRASITPHHFDPRTETTTFRLAVTDSLAVEAVSAITMRLRAAAPLSRIAFSIHTNANSLAGVERGTLDCAVGMFPALPRHMHVQGVRTDQYICVMRRDHEFAQRLTLERFVAANHVLVTPSGNELGVVDGWLSLQGHARSIVAVVNHFADALRIVAESDLLTCVPQSYVEGYGRALTVKHGLVTCALPFETERILHKMIWHERLHTHPAHQWFRALVADVCELPAAFGDEAVET